MRLWIQLPEATQAAARWRSALRVTLLCVERTSLQHLRILQPTVGFPHLLLEVLGGSNILQQLTPSPGQVHVGDFPTGPRRSDGTNSCPLLGPSQQVLVLECTALSKLVQCPSQLRGRPDFKLCGGWSAQDSCQPHLTEYKRSIL